MLPGKAHNWLKLKIDFIEKTKVKYQKTKGIDYMEPGGNPVFFLAGNQLHTFVLIDIEEEKST